MKKSIAIFLFFLFSFASLAQEATFKVVAVKGKVSTNNELIAQSAEIKATQSITIADDSSYICLISNDKKGIIEVNKKGSYQMADLKKQAVMLENNYNYAKVVANELLEIATAKYDSVKSRLLHMNMTGSVHQFRYVKAMLLPERSLLYSNKMTIKWFLIDNLVYEKQVLQYKVMLFNLDDILLFEEKTSKMQLIIDLSSKKELLQERILALKIILLDKSGKELVNQTSIDGNTIIRMEESEKQQITQELNTIFKDQNRETAFAKLVEAQFFEDKGLYIDAINAYEDVLKLSFGAESYQKVYRFFLERNGFVETD